MNNKFSGALRLVQDRTWNDCGGSHASLGSQIREERLHVGLAELAWMTQAVVAPIAPRPPDVGLFGTEAEVLCAAGPAHLVEQLHRQRRLRRAQSGKTLPHPDLAHRHRSL